MKNITSSITLLVFTFALLVSNSFSQPAFVSTTTSAPFFSPSSRTTNLGRDFWFCIPQNYNRSLSGTTYFFAIFISSPRKTTAYVQYGQRPPVPYAITANQTRALFSPTDVPTSLMLESS